MDQIDMTMKFREATPADVSQVVGLVESAYRGEASREGWTSEADLLSGQRTDPEAVASIVDKTGHRLLLAERDGELVACCHIDSTGYFGMFAVQPGRQGGGLGKAVLAEAERVAVELWDLTEMHMTVIAQRTELIAWYERRGYRRTGKTSPFPYGDERFGIPTRSDLEFEVLVKPLT